MTTTIPRLSGRNRQPRPLEEQLSRLTSGLRRARHGGFLLVSYDHADQQQPWLDIVRNQLGPDACFFYPAATAEGEGIVQRISEMRSSTELTRWPLAVLVVRGLEELPDEAQERTLTNLNLMRTWLTETGYPLLVCADAAVLGSVVKHAPDLFDRVQLWIDLRGHTPPALDLLPPADSTDSTDSEQHYLATIARHYHQVEFRGIPTINKPVALPLTDFYVPLKASHTVLINEPPTPTPELLERMHADPDARKHPPPDLAERPRPQRREKRILAVQTAIHEQAALVVLGDPGAGKSTLLRYLALAAAEGWNETAGLPAARGHGWVPMLIPCAAYSTALSATPGMDPDLLDFIPSYLEQQYELPRMHEVVHTALEQGRALLLLDGLDEILESQQRLAVVQAIDRLLRTWVGPGKPNRALITSRIVGYGSAALTAATMVITLRDFERDEQATFLRGWCVAYERFVHGDTPEAEQAGIEQAEQLAGELDHNEGARRLAGNPLLLTIIALVQRQGVQLPQHRVELYDIAVRTLIETWNRARSLSGTALPALPDTRTVSTLLADLALWMQQHSAAGTATEADLLPILEEGYQQRGNPQPQQAAVAFLHDVQHYSGLLIERGPQRYSFMHLTFQEYFAARALADMADGAARWRIIAPHLDDPRWRETILLTADELGIMKRRAEEVTDLVRRIVQSIPPPSTMTRWLFKQARRRPHLLAPLLTERQLAQLEEHYLRRRLRLAGWILTDDVGVEQSLALQIAEKLALDTGPHRRREDGAAILHRLPAHLQHDLAHSMATHLAQKQPGVREAAAQALGAIGSSDPAVLQSLREALRDDDSDVRRAAAEALGASTSSDPAVLQSLREALRDKDRRVRAAVATVLYRAGVRSPAVRVTLLAEVAFGSPWTDTYSMLVSEDEEEEHEEESIVYITPVRGDE
jgi:hypothetical protein